MTTLWQHPEFQHLGWTLLHTLWQGAILFGLAALLLRLWRNKSPQFRYVIACGALLVMVLLAVVTYAYHANITMATVQDYSQDYTVAAIVANASVGQTATDTLLSGVILWMPLGWMLGVMILTIRLLGGWYWFFHGLRDGAMSAPSEWQWRLASLCRLLGLKRKVRLMVSKKVKVPLAVGWIKPTILLPASAILHLDTEALEAIVAHELAHIRRYDYLINFAQSIVEVLFFYHPTTWWLSGQIRELREHCCDDVAVSHCGSAISYASALTNLETLRVEPVPPHLALAANGATLMNRIKRLLNVAEPASSGIRAGVAAAMVISVIGAGTLWGLSNDFQQKQERQRIVVRDGDSRLTVQMQGEVKLDTGSKDGLLLGEDAIIQIVTSEKDTTRRFSMSREGTEIKKSYRENGQQKEMDAVSEAWLNNQIQEIERVEARKIILGASNSDKIEFEITEDGRNGKDSKVIAYSNKSPHFFFMAGPGNQNLFRFDTETIAQEWKEQAERLKEQFKDFEFPGWSWQETENNFYFNREELEQQIKELRELSKNFKFDSIKFEVDSKELKAVTERLRELRGFYPEFEGRFITFPNSGTASIFRSTPKDPEAQKQQIEKEVELLKERLGQLEEELKKVR